jgi:hypothetical protein
MSSITLPKPKKTDADLQRLPVVQAMLQALTHDDEQVRTAACNVAVGTLRGKSRSVIIDGLVALLRRKDVDVRQQAACTLVAFGPVAIPALLLGLWRGRDAAWQIRLAQVLTAIVPQVPAPERSRLFFEVDRALWTARDEAVVRACVEVQKALMKEGDSPKAGQAASVPHRSGKSPSPACCVRQESGLSGT